MPADQSAPQASSVQTSWLCRDDFDRQRMLDMEDRVRPARRRTFAILAITIAAMAPWLGWWPLLFLTPAGLFFFAADAAMPRVRRPEYVMFAAWIGSELMIAGAVTLEGGEHVAALLSWVAIPVITLATRFSMRGVAAGVSFAILLVLAVSFGVDAHGMLAHPEIVAAPLALLLCVAALSMPLMASDIKHRNDAVIDQLTGMLNRTALSVRVLELAEQSELTAEPVGLIVGDLDHFKQVNDTRGHSVGDAVLKEVAYLLRKQLRAFDLAYRLGGEEFLILMPGSNLERTAQLAERLRERICAEPLGGVQTTMSFGVAASAQSKRFDYDAVFTEADMALYRAKRGGRNRVSVSGPLAEIPDLLPALAESVV